MSQLAIFHLKRQHYRRERTLGELIHPDGSHFCWTLEDTVRGYGIKDYGNTAFPATEGDFTYYLRVKDSGIYGRVSTIFTHERDGLTSLEYGGIKFTHIRCHGGNTEKDTYGCLLVSKFRDVDKMKTWSKLTKEMTLEVASLTIKELDVRLRVTNLPQQK